MKVIALFHHPKTGVHHVTTNVESVEEFKAKLKELGCTIAFVEEVKD